MSSLRTFGGVLLNRFSGKLAKNNHGFFNDSRLNQLFQVSSYFGARNNNVYLSTDATKKKEKTDSLLAMDPNRFAGHLQKLGIRRCFVVWDFEEGKVKVSHPELEELAQFCSADKVNYDEHEGVFMEVGRRTGVLMGAFVWRTYRGQACGGIRLWNYPGMDRYLTDGLRLAQGMGVKSALAGLWAGGGKGVVQEPMHNKHRDPSFRQNMFFDYGDFLSSLNGCYVSAEDVGLNVNDLNNVMQRTRYTTCISEELGGSGNPSILTGKGVVCAMEAALDFLSMGTLKEKTVAIQGAGNVALVIIETLLEKGVKYIYVTECHQNRVDDMKRVLADKANGRLEIQKVPIDDTSIMSYNCDILSPCALGGILNEDTIPQISAPIVCGAANNQLRCPEDNQLLKERGITYIVDYVANRMDNQLLKERGITYIVDYVANRMGIVNCANETYGRLPDDPAITRHLGRDWENSVFKITKEILQKAEQEDVTPVEAADVLADKASRELHPIWPHRSQQIIKALVAGGWHKGNNIYGSQS